MLDLAGVKKDTDFACLYHCDFGDPQRFSQMLQNMINHHSAYEFDTFRLKLVMVAHGAGLKFFLDDRSGTPWEKDRSIRDIYQRFVGLTKYGVEAYLCQITYKRLNIDPGQDPQGRVPEVRALRRRDGRRAAGQGLRLSEGRVRRDLDANAPRHRVGSRHSPAGSPGKRCAARRRVRPRSGTWRGNASGSR